MSDDRFEQIKSLIEDLRLSHLSESARRSLSRVSDHVKDRNIGIITAQRKEKNAVENRSNNKALEQNIRKAGFGFIRVRGGWVEQQKKTGKKAPVTEPSYIVVGNKHDDGEHLKSFLSNHGDKYDQDAVVYKHRSSPNAITISTTDRDPEKPRGTETDIGAYHPGRFGDYFTALSGDAPTNKSVKKMTPDERKAHREASLKRKTFVFGESVEPQLTFSLEHCIFEFSEDEQAPVKSINELTLYARMAKDADAKRAKKNE